MIPENQDPVWNLLRKARKVEPSPFFARNVVREVRLLGARREPTLASRVAEFFTLPRIAFAAAAILIAAVAAFQLGSTATENAGAQGAPEAIAIATGATVTAPALALVADNTAPAPSPNANANLNANANATALPEALDVPDDVEPAEYGYEDELEMIDYMDGLIAVQNIETLDDEALAELLF